MLDIALLLGRVLFLSLVTLFLWQIYRVARVDLETAARATAPPVAGEPRLVALAAAGGLEPGQTYPIRGEVTIGRAPDSVIRVDDAYCSQRHARVWWAGGRCWIEDSGSTNGTLLDGRRLPVGEAVELNPGAEVRIGETLLGFER